MSDQFSCWGIFALNWIGLARAIAVKKLKQLDPATWAIRYRFFCHLNSIVKIAFFRIRGRERIEKTPIIITITFTDFDGKPYCFLSISLILVCGSRKMPRDVVVRPREFRANGYRFLIACLRLLPIIAFTSLAIAIEGGLRIGRSTALLQT